jgi:hypothetical protein
MSDLVPRALAPSHQPVLLAWRDRRALHAIESSAALELIQLQLRQNLTQATILCETAVTHTAMASVTGTQAAAGAFKTAVADAGDALTLLQGAHVANQKQRIEQFAQGR